MPKDDDVDLAPSPWPPAFTPTFVEQVRARLDTSHVLVLSGPTAGSRDRLAGEVAGILDRPAQRRHVARRGEADLPYFAIDQLCLGTRLPSDASSEDVEAVVREQLAGLPRPLRIVLCQAELCDRESVDLLVRLAERGHLQLVATTTPEALPQDDRLRSAGDVVEVPPLDAVTLSELVLARFDALPEPALVDMVLRRTAGSYPFVRQLLDACAASGAVVVRDGVLVADPAAPGAEWLRLPAPEDSPTLADLIDVTALLGRLDLDEARECFGGPEVDLGTSCGILSLVDDVLQMTYAAESSPLRRTLSQPRQADLFGRFIDGLPLSIGLVGAAPRAADWWRAAGRPLPVELAARAAREANLQGRYRRALVYSDPANNEDGIAVAPIERAFALIAVGDVHAFGALITSLDPASLTEDELYVFLFTLAIRGGETTSDDLIRRAVASDHPDVRRRREAVHVLADLVHRTFAMSGEKVAGRLRALAFSGQLSPGNRAAAFAALSAALCHAGRPLEGVRASEFALGILEDSGRRTSAFHLDATREIHVLALVSAVDLTGAEQALADYPNTIFDGVGGGRLMPALHAFVCMQRGWLKEALESAQHFLAGLGAGDPYQLRGWVEAMAAECLMLLGRATEALEYLGAATRHPSQLPTTDLSRRITIAATRDAQAEPEEALEILNEVIDEAQRRGLLLARIEAAAAGVIIGGPPQLGRLLEAVGELDDVEVAGTPRIWQTFARGVRDYDIRLIVDLALELEEREALLMAAGVAQSVLDMARRATDLDGATRAHLTRLADLSGRARG